VHPGKEARREQRIILVARVVEQLDALVEELARMAEVTFVRESESENNGCRGGSMRVTQLAVERERFRGTILAGRGIPTLPC
jgi:hypothetical protein